MATNDRLFLAYCMNLEFIFFCLQEVALVATKKAALYLLHDGCCTLSKIETSGKEKEGKGGNCLFFQEQAQVCRTFQMQMKKTAREMVSSMSTDWDIP